MSVRVRFAPSPTGYLHIGGARTALYNWLFARANGGTFILRIEDTDRNRYVADAEKAIFDSLIWLGMEWDEGPDVGGSFGPYRQSERLELYREHARQLIEKGAAYPCFCSAERLEEIRKSQQEQKLPQGYDRYCRDMDPREAQKRIEQGERYVIRLKIPLTGETVFHDSVRGEIHYSNKELDDLVLMKTDGFPTYHLANVIDDHFMKITHVMRGDEWIASTPRHVLLYQAFGWDMPEFVHLPVILAPGGGKLSKRHGGVAVMDFKQNGYLPLALLNFISLLGWSPGEDRELMSLAEIVRLFSIDRISPKSAVFDEQKLDWFNSQYIINSDAATLLKDVFPLWMEQGWVNFESESSDSLRCVRIIELLRERCKKLTDFVEGKSYFFRDPESYEEKAEKKQWAKENPIPLLEYLIDRLAEISFNAQDIQAHYHEYAIELGVGNGQLIHPTRLAISGTASGPGLFELMELLGKETVTRRLKQVINYLHIKYGY